MLFGISPFIIALALIVVVYIYFANFYVQRLRGIFASYLTDLTYQTAAMQQGVMISTTMLTHYVGVIKKIHGEDFLDNTEHFNKEQREAFEFILYGKVKNAPASN